MPRSKESKEYQKQYILKYKKEKYHRVGLDLTHENYAQVKAAAENANETVTGYIRKAIQQRMDSGV